MDDAIQALETTGSVNQFVEKNSLSNNNCTYLMTKFQVGPNCSTEKDLDKVDCYTKNALIEKLKNKIILTHELVDNPFYQTSLNSDRVNDEAILMTALNSGCNTQK